MYTIILQYKKAKKEQITQLLQYIIIASVRIVSNQILMIFNIFTHLFLEGRKIN